MHDFIIVKAELKLREMLPGIITKSFVITAECILC